MEPLLAIGNDDVKLEGRDPDPLTTMSKAVRGSRMSKMRSSESTKIVRMTKPSSFFSWIVEFRQTNEE